MTVLHGGYDGAGPPGSGRDLALWRIGRWLRARGLQRPKGLHRAEDGLVVVDGRVIAIHADGRITDLSADPRPQIRPQGRDA